MTVRETLLRGHEGAILAAVAAVADHDVALPVDELRVEPIASDRRDRDRGGAPTDGQGER